MSRVSILIILTLFLMSSNISAAEHMIGRFSSADLSGWTEKIFKGKTDYAIVIDEGKKVLKAHSRHAASGLLKEINIDPKQKPVLNWSWKIEHSLKREDIAKKSGDDFAARVYIVFPRSFFWQTRAINYVWANKMTKGSHAPSPYTGNNTIVAVESGDDKAGNWIIEQRNVYEDYRKFFAEEPPAIGAIAVMTDTDDTQDEITAWYGDIYFSTPKK